MAAPASIELANDRLRVHISPLFGALLVGHAHDGRPFLRPCAAGGEPFRANRSACFPLVPLGNRVEHNGFAMDGRHHTFRPNTAGPLYVHGDGWLAEWAVREATAARVQLTFAQARPANSPHVYDAVQTVALDGATLRLDLAVTNRGAEPMPFGIGFHPYFPRTPLTRLWAPAGEWWTEAPDMLPLAREPLPAVADFNAMKRLPECRLNNAFEGWNGAARIEWPEAGLAGDLVADAVFSHYMVFAPQEDRSFFCLEPMSHAPNALALSGPAGMHVLEPGGTLAGGFSLTVSDLASGEPEHDRSCEGVPP